MKVLITGASGILGGHLVRVLESRGHEVRRASRSDRPGWVRIDLEDEGSIRAACEGVDAVVHCAADAMNPRKVEVEPLARFRAAAPDARVVYPSIVGCDKINFSYYKAKAEGEKALTSAGGDHAVLRLTQFHEFADRLARLPVPMVFVGMRAQTIAASEAAEQLADVMEGDGQGLVGEAGGPEVHPMVDLIKQRMRADGRRRPVLRLPVGTKGFRAGYNLCPERKVGKITWKEHLEASRKEIAEPQAQ